MSCKFIEIYFSINPKDAAKEDFNFVVKYFQTSRKVRLLVWNRAFVLGGFASIFPLILNEIGYKCYGSILAYCGH